MRPGCRCFQNDDAATKALIVPTMNDEVYRIGAINSSSQAPTEISTMEAAVQKTPAAIYYF